MHNNENNKEFSTDIFKLLPHRYPLLLIDKVLELNLEQKIVKCLKNVSFNEEFFNGHFPSNPIMPGVLILEALAQCGIVCIKNFVIGIDNKSIIYLTGFDNIKFTNSVKPGDCLILQSHLVKYKTINNLMLYSSNIIAFVEDKQIVSGTLKGAVNLTLS